MIQGSSVRQRRNGLSAVAQTSTPQVNHATFERLYRRYAADVLHMCERLVKNQFAAEEIAQEVFVRVYRQIDRVDEGRGAWPLLMTITRRLCIDYNRGLRVRGKRGSEEEHATAVDRASLRNNLDPTAEEVFRRQDGEKMRAVLLAALSKLPDRDRRVLWLRDIEEWDYPDIAGADGSTPNSVRQLAWRARNQVRAFLGEARSGLLALNPIGLVLLLQRLIFSAGRRARALPSRATSTVQGFSSAGVGERLPAAMSSFGAAFVALISAFSTLVPGTAGSGTVLASSALLQGRSAGGKAVATASVRQVSSPQTPPVDSPYRDPQDQIKRRVTDPSSDATPENSGFLSFVPAPGYGKSNLILLGLADCTRIGVPCRVVFRSADGGASWRKLRSAGLTADSLVLPPEYPKDSTIFAMGRAGLQESRDGGSTFTTVSPVAGSIALSTRFDRGDPRIFIGGREIYVYDARIKQTMIHRTVPLEAQDVIGLARGLRPRVTLSPDFSDDGLFFSSVTRRLGASQVYRCDPAGCAATLPEDSVSGPRVAFPSSHDHAGTVWIQANEGFFESRDEGRTFKLIHDSRAPSQSRWQLGGVVEAPLGGHRKRSLLAPGRDREVTGDTILRSGDGGRTWRRLPSAPLYYYGVGTEWLATSSIGQIFAFSQRGIACSVDGGAAWHPRCAHP